MKKLMFLAVLAYAAMGALSLAGAGAAAKPASASSTPRAVGHPGANGLVRQVGLRNYAGPNCPGKGWNCTTVRCGVTCRPNRWKSRKTGCAFW